MRGTPCPGRAALARLIRCAMVASGTRKACAISAVVRPPTARGVSASCDGGDRSGWQQRNSSVSVSSCSAAASGAPGAPAGPPATRAAGGSATNSPSSRRRRATSARTSSVSRREATVISHPAGLSGTPSRGHCKDAASSASWTASSHSSKRPWRRTSAARTRGAASRSVSSTRRFTPRRRRCPSARAPPAPSTSRPASSQRSRPPVPRSRRRP